MKNKIIDLTLSSALLMRAIYNGEAMISKRGGPTVMCSSFRRSATISTPQTNGRWGARPLPLSPATSLLPS